MGVDHFFFLQARHNLPTPNNWGDGLTEWQLCHLLPLYKQQQQLACLSRLFYPKLATTVLIRQANASLALHGHISHLKYLACVIIKQHVYIATFLFSLHQICATSHWNLGLGGIIVLVIELNFVKVYVNLWGANTCFAYTHYLK